MFDAHRQSVEGKRKKINERNMITYRGPGEREKVGSRIRWNA